MNIIENYAQAIKLRIKTQENLIQEMEEPRLANFAQNEYHFPNGIMCGVGKSRRPGHASFFQIIVIDFNGKPNIKFPAEFSGEYTTQSRAELGLKQFCKKAWEAAEGFKTKQVRKTEAAKELSKKEQMDEMLAHKEVVVTEVKAEPELIEIPELADLTTPLDMRTTEAIVIREAEDATK